jgi:uncharacterized RDD family membrane protein YckC
MSDEAAGPGSVVGYPAQPGLGGWPPGLPAGWGARPVPPPAGPAPGIAWAGLRPRLGALLLDGLVVFGTLILAGLLDEAVGVRSSGSDYLDYPPAAVAITMAWFGLLFLYHPVSWYLWGATPGQRMLGLRVVRAGDGLRLGLGAATVRFLVFAVCTFTVVLAIVAGIMAAEDPYKRSWHDLAARSVVVRRA